MPSYLRYKLDGSTYFFTVVTQGRRPWFRSENFRRVLRRCFREARRMMPFDVDAVVLLPDHLHILMRPADGVDYSALWRLIKTRFTRSVTPTLAASDPAVEGRRKGERGIWQRRFYEHTIRNDDDWGRHMDYIHFNPVKHGLVDKPSEWAWSSFRCYVRGGWLEPDWPGGRKVSFPNVQE